MHVRAVWAYPEERDRDRYGRVVAVCRAAGEDLNAWMVSQGWALAYRQYSRDYVGEEADARAARRGIWRGDFVEPWDWRPGERLGTPLTWGQLMNCGGQMMGVPLPPWLTHIA